MRTLSKILGLTLFCSLSACGIYKNKSAAPKIDSSALTDPSVKITYAQINQALFLPSCVSCHSQSNSKGGVALDNYSRIQAHISAVKHDIDHHIMPAQGSLTESQIELFDRWYSQGYPELTDSPSQPSSPSASPTATPDSSTPPTLTKVTWTQVNKEVIQLRCVSCHNTAQPSGGVNLDSFAHFMTWYADVVPDIDSNEMPLDGPLTPTQKQLFDTWVQQGSEGDSDPSNGTPTPTPVPAPDLNNQTITLIRNNFNLSIEPLVKRACMDCHDSHAKPEGIGTLPIVKGVELKHIQEATKALDFSRTFPSWSDYSNDPMFYLSQLKGVLVNNTMPLKVYVSFHEFDGKLLRSHEKQIILNWIEESKQLLTKTATTPPSARDYLNNHCMGCHNSAISSGGFVLGSGKSINGIPEISPFHPENSALYLVLLSDPKTRKGLPQMPYGDLPTAEEQKLIFDWITSGAH